MVKVTYILSLIFKSLEYEWIVRYIDRSKIELSFILLNPEECELQRFLVSEGVNVHHVPFHGKRSYPSAFLSCYRILNNIKPDYINCNLLDANLLGLTAGLLAGVPNRIQTRHHSTFHHVYFPKGKMYDRYSNFLSTEIVAVSSLVKRVLVEMEGVPERKIRIISHGFALVDFQAVSESRVDTLKVKFGLGDKKPVIGAISRYIEWKGVQFIIPAFKELLKMYPNAILLIANARQGTYTPYIDMLLKELPGDSYREIEFESDILAFYKLLDVFIHIPIDDHSEAYGRIYPESLASGVPMVCTLSGIANDIIKDGYNARVVPYKNSEKVKEAIVELLNNQDLRNSIRTNAQETALEFADMSIQKHLLEDLYLSRA